MRTYSFFLSLSLSVLAGCTSAPAISADKATTSVAAGRTYPPPGLANPLLETGERMPAPEAISKLLLSLPEQDVLASRELRQRYLDGNVLVERAQAPAASDDYLVIDRIGSQYGFWIRSFQGNKPGLTGYLVEVRGSCAKLNEADPAFVKPVAAAVRQCAVKGAGHFDSGLRAYRVIKGQPPEDVTASIAPDPAVSSDRMLEKYWSMGASPVFATDENLDRLPIFRWVVEYDMDQPAPISDPHSFYYGHMAHAGFVVWDGERFENRKTVPRALWPCEKWLDDDGRVLPCPDATPEGDRFISDGQ